MNGRDSGGRSAANDESVRLSVPEMDCSNCAGKVRRSVESLDGVAADPDPTTGVLRVKYDPAATDAGAIRERVEAAGYAVDDSGGDEADLAGFESPHEVWTTPRAGTVWAGATLMVAGLAVEFLLAGLDATLFSALGRAISVADALVIAAALVGGWAVLRSGYYSLRTRSLDVDLLMSAGIVGALAAAFYVEAATLAVLYSIAELLERFSMERARSSVSELLELSPDEATVRRDGEERVVPAADLVVGDRVVVRPGEKVPADGVVCEGRSALDQSPITGESVPVGKVSGDEVYAGTISEDGYLEVEVTAPANESTLARIVELVADAGRAKTEHERFVDRFAGYYTPAVVAAAILTATVPPLALGASWSVWFVRGLALLVLACPCAFVISTPVSVVSGITSAARNGVLIKGGPTLETMGEVKAVAFDKTGTLTAGELAVADVVGLGEHDESDVLARAGALERRSEHPIARAIVEAADERGVEDREADDFEALTGEGVSGDVDGRSHYVGKPGLFADLGFDLEHSHATTDGGVQDASAQCERGDCVDLAGEVVPRLQREGKTVVLVGTAEELIGVVAVADSIRPEAARMVARLREQGVERIVMLTGDNERTAGVVAETVGVDDYRAGLLPEEKVEAIRDIEERYGSVAMVGDGVNDAPALAAASVGVAMGAAGTDTAIETADVALMGDDLRSLPYLHRLSRKANAVIRQNIVASLGAKALLAAGVPLGLVTVAVAVVVGDMGMSLTVTGNAMRLAGVSPELD
jgi:Cd2+/Zn2+-exporting ATPase